MYIPTLCNYDSGISVWIGIDFGGLRFCRFGRWIKLWTEIITAIFSNVNVELKWNVVNFCSVEWAFPQRSGVRIQGIAGPPETALNLNQGSFSAHSLILQSVYIQCWTAGTLKVHWTHTPLRLGLEFNLRIYFLAWNQNWVGYIYSKPALKHFLCPDMDHYPEFWKFRQFR